MVKNKITLFALFICVSWVHCSAQSVKVDQNVQTALNYYSEYYKNKNTFRGYRIQIITTTNRRKMDATLTKFRNLYPEYHQKWSYEEPYYKVTIGAFLKKLKANKALYHFRKEFPGSILVFSNIKKTELID